MSKLYHTRYKNRPKSGSPAAKEAHTWEETVVLEDIHPLVWASQPTEGYSEHFWTEILDWREVDDPDGSIARAIREGRVLHIEGPN